MANHIPRCGVPLYALAQEEAEGLVEEEKEGGASHRPLSGQSAFSSAVDPGIRLPHPMQGILEMLRLLLTYPPPDCIVGLTQRDWKEVVRMFVPGDDPVEEVTQVQ